MTRRHVTRHQTGHADTLNALARQYRLSSPQAIVDAPDNVRILAQHTGGGALPSGLLLAIPPSAAELLKERIYVLDRIRPLVLEHFVGQESLLERDVLRVADGGDVSDPQVVDEILRALKQDVEEDLESIAVHALALAATNDALATTHIHAKIILQAGSTRDPGHVGLQWLCGAELYPIWLDIWSTSYWVSRWDGSSWPEATRDAGLYLNLVRSKVVQYVDSQFRQSNALIQQLMLERLD